MKIVNYEFPHSSFLSVEKDMEIILRKLFVDSKPHSDVLKKLLTIPMKDCLAKDGRNLPHLCLPNICKHLEITIMKLN